MLVRRRTPVEVGWFGSKIAKGIAKGVKSVAKVATKVPIVSQGVNAARFVGDVAKGKNVVQSARKRAGAVLGDIRSQLPMAASVVSVMPGVGTGAAMGITALSSASQGKSIRQIGEDAALAAVPGGQLARSALKAGLSVAHGGNVLKSVGREGIAYARTQVPGGELAQRAINAGLNIAQGGNVIRSVTREGASYVQSRLPTAQLAQRVVGAAGSPITSMVRSAASNLPQVKMPLVRPSYGQVMSVSPENIGRSRSLVGRMRPNMRPNISAKNATASFRPLSRVAYNTLVRAIPHMRSEVSGLSENGGEWIVEAGDTGSKIALKLTGNANRWTELRPVNPKIMGRGAAAVKKYGFPIYVNDRVILPASWIKVANITPAQTAPSQPSEAKPPPVELPGGDLAAQGQARTILAAWGKSDGAREPGLSDYGSASELAATIWTARDMLQASAFANWWRRFGGPPAVQDGNWSDPLSVALNMWAEKKAQTVANSAMAAGGFVIPPITALPPVVTPPPVIVTPVPTPAAPAPSPSQAPAPVAQQAPPGSTPTITLPTIVLGGDPITWGPQTQPAAQPVAVPTAGTQAAQQAAATPAAKQPMNDNMKWGLWTTGLSVAGAVISHIML